MSELCQQATSFDHIIGDREQTRSGHCTSAAVHKKEICEIDHNGKVAPLLFCALSRAGATAMAGTQWTNKRRALVISAFTLSFAAFLRVAAPQLVPTAELLGSNWQCTKTAFVLTTCTQVFQPFAETAQNAKSKN
jgi:hypothetical protein